MNVVIYARYSSHNQTEQSIEGQLQVCYEFAKKNNYTVVKEYIDRAQTGTNDNRLAFREMIEDSNKKLFNGVLVYQLDRFSRNRYDSAIYKNKLKKNNVRVFSARENIAEDASGILVESVLEGVAEYYSAELSQKVKRGMKINAEKCLYNGGGLPLGYKIDENKKYQIDENTAHHVKKMFEMYADNYTMQEISQYLENNNIRTTLGNKFKNNSISAILRNKRYKGIYIYNDLEIAGGVPRIITDELFDEVQRALDKNKHAPARSKSKIEYLLTTKLFCGHCEEMMTGMSGTSRNGLKYAYYVCNGVREKKCKKKNVQKDLIENIVIEETRKMLTDDRIKELAEELYKVFESEKDTSNIKRLSDLLKNKEKQKNNLIDSLSLCENENIKKSIFEKLGDLEREKTEIEKEIRYETLKSNNVITEQDIRFFFNKIKEGNINDIKYRKMLINTMINKIYLYDDKIIIIFNIQDQKVEIDNDTFEKIKCSFFNESGEPK